MSLLYTASFKEFGPLVCLWHDVNFEKRNLRSGHLMWPGVVTFGVIGSSFFFFLMCQIVGWTAMANLAAFFALSLNFPENFRPRSPKIRSPGQVKWPHLRKKITIGSRPQWLRERFEAFRIWYTTKYLQIVYLGFLFYIGDLRSGQFRYLPIISQWGKLKCLKYWSALFKSLRTMLS